MTEAGISVPQSGPPQHDLLVRLQNPNHAQSPTLARAYMVEAAATITDLRGQVERLTTENFAFAAGLCPGHYGDDYGHSRCKMVDAAQSRVSVLEGALRQAIDRMAMAVEWNAQGRGLPMMSAAIELAARTINERSLPVNAPDRALPVSPGELVAWHAPDAIPDVKPGHEGEFVIAIYRSHSGKVYTFAASYLNAYPLEYRDECPKGSGCEGVGCDDGCPTSGWFSQTGDDNYSSMYNGLNLHDGDKIMGWTNLPIWPAPPSFENTAGEKK